MKKTTGLLCSVGFVIFIISSCSKNYTCGHSVSYAPVNIAFKGYSSGDLSKVAITIYDSQSNKLEADTFDFSGAPFSADTAYIPNNSENGRFLNIQGGKGYEINVIARNKTYRITNVHEGDKMVSWSQKDECSMGTTVPERRPYQFDLDTKPVGQVGYFLILAD